MIIFVVSYAFVVFVLQRTYRLSKENICWWSLHSTVVSKNGQRGLAQGDSEGGPPSQNVDAQPRKSRSKLLDVISLCPHRDRSAIL